MRIRLLCKLGWHDYHWASGNQEGSCFLCERCGDLKVERAQMTHLAIDPERQKLSYVKEMLQSILEEAEYPVDRARLWTQIHFLLQVIGDSGEKAAD